MAHTIDNYNYNLKTTNPATTAHTAGAGTTVLILAIVVAGAVERAGGAPTYNGVTLTQAGITRKYATSPETNVELWYLLAPSIGGSLTVSIPNTDLKSIWFVVTTFKAQTGYATVLDVQTGNTGNTLNPSLAPSASANGDVMVEVLGSGNASVPTGRTHTSLYTYDWGQYVAAVQYGLIASAGTVTAGFTIAADDWGMCVALFKEQTTSPPAAPTAAHTDSKTANQVVMHWTDNSNNESGFKMYKNDVYIETIAAGSVSYTFINLDPSTQYDLAVRATNAYGTSAEAQLTETTYSAPAAPTAAHTDSKTDVQVAIGWTDNATDETGYKMYKNDVYLETIAAGSVSYTFTGLSGNTQYDLAVRATNANGDSAEAQLTETTYTTPSGTVNLNVGDWFKNVDTAPPDMKINIGDVWKIVMGMQINIGDVWKTIFLRTANLSYYGEAPVLSPYGSNDLAATAIGNYALFGGGYANDQVNAYDTSLVRTRPSGLIGSASRGEAYLAAAAVGSYALFGGGRDLYYDSPAAFVTAYDTSLTRTTPTALSSARESLTATAVGNYALFGGGTNQSISLDVVDAYDTSLVRTTPTVLSVARSNFAATRVGNYALFGGNSTVVDAYSTSLVRSTPTALSIARYDLAATAVGNYALFGGGVAPGYYDSAVVDAYNTSLTRSTPTALSVARATLAATTVGTYALFGGGTANYYASPVIDAYDTSLTRSIPTPFPAGRGDGIAAANVGIYALFGGGYMNQNNVFAYQYA